MDPERSPSSNADRWWRAWQERLDHGEDPAEFMQAFSDQALVMLLKTAGDDRATERNLILAETLRRLSGRPSERSAMAAKVLDDTIHDTSRRLDATAQAVHETEAAVEAKASAEHRGGKEKPRRVSHGASRQVETLRDLAHEVQKKADNLMRLHRTGEFVTPGRAGEETEGDSDA